MSIWKTSINLEELNRINENTMVEHLGIIFTEFGDDFLTASMPVDERTKQIYGIMHGGASATLAETIGSIAANYCVDFEKHYCAGLDINISHLKMVKVGIVKGVAKPIHIGRSTQVWQVKIFDQNENLVSLSRLTMAVLDKKLPHR